MKCSFGELRNKEVINLCDGCRLGCICDLEINTCDGCILAIVVPCQGRFFGFLRGEKDIVIPFNKICKIGDDVILVDIDPGICCC